MTLWGEWGELGDTQEPRDNCDFQNYNLPSNILSAFNEMRLGNELTDIVLTAEGRDFACHRTVLAAGSPYFKAMFTGSLQENELHNVTLQVKLPSDSFLILDYLNLWSMLSISLLR